MKRTIGLIANPNAARGRLVREKENIAAWFHENEIEVEWRMTERPRHAMALAEEMTRAGWEEIVAAGGDGTAFETLNGILRSGRADRVHFGILPMGTGNSFLRDFGIRDWREAARRIRQGGTQRMDAGRITLLDQPGEPEWFFHNMVGLGLIAEACRLRHTRYSFLRTFAYHAAFFNLLPFLKTYSLRMRLDDQEEQSMECPLLAVCNSQYTGHDMRLSPSSRSDDGRMEIMYASPLSVSELFRLFLQLPSGNHLQHPKVHLDSLNRLEVEMEGIGILMMDGEIFAGKRLYIEVLPGAWNLML